MGCFCDALENERERKNDFIMYRKKEIGINCDLDEENGLIENESNKNEDLEIFPQNKINLFDIDDEKGKAPITKNNLEVTERLETDERNKLIRNEENNSMDLKKIEEDEIKNQENDSHNKIEDNIPLNQRGGKGKDQLKFNKNLCKSIATLLPKRTKIKYQSFKDLLKTRTVNLSDKEKSFVIFLWICDNIAIDTDSYFSGKVDSTFSSAPPRLYKDFADYLNLEVECVTCYAKGEGYHSGKKMTSINHEYNVIKLNNKWYPIDSTWGAGHVDGKKYIKSYNEFYFLANPELLIKTHFPADDKWQLTKKKYTLEEFLKWPRIYSHFYTLGFEKYFPEEGVIELKDKNIQKFIIYGNTEQNEVKCKIYRLEENNYIQQTKSYIINCYKDRFEINTIFWRKGKYKVEIYGKKVRGNYYLFMLEYAVNVENDDLKNLDFPLFYAGKENINIIEPLYDDLRSGEKVKFKFESTLNDFVIIDDKEWHHLKRNAQGYFEFETIIKSKKGNYVIIAHKTGFITCRDLVRYNVV